MKGQRKLRERLTAIALSLALIAGMVIEPAQIRAAQSEETAAVQEEEGIAAPQTAGDGEEENKSSADEPEGEQEQEQMPAADYSISVSEMDSKTEAYVGDTLTFKAELTGTPPSNPTITWSADNGVPVTDNGNDTVSITIPKGTTPGTVITVTADCGGGSESVSVTIKERVYTVSGTVTASGVGVPGAVVKLGNFEPQTTGGNGSYSISDVPDGTYNFTIARDGFQEYQNSVTVKGADVTSCDASLSLADASASVDKSVIKVGETTEAHYECKLADADGVSVSWASSDDTVASVDGNGTITGIKSGKTTITPTINSNYGPVSASGIEVEVQECSTEIKSVEINQNVSDNDKYTKFEIDVTVGTEIEGVIPTGGDVSFKITQEDITAMRAAPKTYTIALVDGVASLRLSKQSFDFSGNYTVEVQYSGNSGYYLASDPETENCSYALQGLKYVDQQENEITSGSDSPLELTYGETATIWVKEDKPGVTSDVVINDTKTVEIQKQQSSVKQGYTEFLIKAVKADDSEKSVTFKKTDGTEDLYSKLYVKVKPRELHIDSDENKSFMRCSKIYDGNNGVFVNQESKDSIVLERIGFKADEVLPGDEGKVSVNLNLTERIEGTFTGDVDASQERDTEITFSQACLELEKNGDGNYVLAAADATIPAKIVIQQREVNVTVSNATRSFGHAYNNGIVNEPDYIFAPEEWLSIETCETEPGKDNGIRGIIDEFQKPTSESALIELQDGGNAAKLGEHVDALSVDISQLQFKEDKKKENYTFNIKEGTLTIQKENVTDPGSYIQFENSGSNQTMYIKEQIKEIWVKADKGTLKLEANTQKLYNEVLLTKVGGKDIPPVSLTKDGYTFERGEDVQTEEEVVLTLQLKNEQGVSSNPFEYNIHLDNTIPEVSISDAEGTKTPLGDFVNKISFGLFGKTQYKVQVKVTEENTSGLREWTYMVLPLKEDMVNDTDGVYDVDNPTDEEMAKSSLLAYIEKLKDSGEYVWQPMNKSDEPMDILIDRKNVGDDFIANNYVVLVKPYDNVNNSKIYTSLGIILDNNDPYVDLDLNYKDGQTYRDVYNDDVKLHMSVTDNHNPADKTVSGLKEVYYQVAIGEENLEKANKEILYQAEKDKKYTLEELEKEAYEYGITISKMLNSNDIWVRATAVDNSGNEFDAVQRLKIDIVRPEVTVRYETKATEDYAPYYKEDRTAIVTVKERNVDITSMDELWFELQREGEQKPSWYTVSSLKALDGITVEEVKDSESGKAVHEYTDDRTIEMRIRFHGDDKYTFDVHCKDKGDWEDEQDNRSYFVIDKTAPELSVVYYNADGTIGVAESEEGRFYSGKPMTAKVEIKEHNFAYEGENVPIDVKVTADKVREDEEIPDYAALEKTNSSEVWSNNVDTYTSIYHFASDANYTHSITYTDLAGNSVSYGAGYFTVDKTNPTGTVEIKGFGFWESLLEKITFGLFTPSAVDVEMTGEDYTSPIRPLQYARVYDQMTREELEAYNGWNTASEENPGYAGFSVSPDEQFVVYTKVTDYAGNYEYFSSDGMIIDSTKPAPKVTVTNLSQSENGIFNEDVTLQIDVEDPTVGGTYSGLERVWYTVSASGNVTASETIELLNNSGNRVKGNETFSQVITVPAKVYNSNDVKVQAFAADFAGNQGESETTELKIDITNPTVSVSWDLNNPSNGKYYKDTRTATVTVTDRNFDSNNVRFSITNTDGAEANISGWSSSSDIGVSDQATSTCQVSFPSDGDYTFTLGCTDLAGNSGEYGQTDEFTIDKTIPVVTVSYDNNSAKNGNYYKEARTATVTVREHNFNAADVRAAITASLQGSGTSAPSVSGFSDSGDVHTATVKYASDGDYTFDIDYTDMAGNQAADYTQDSFTVDLKAPEVEIVDVKDKSANNDVVAPGVKASDTNYDAKNVTLTVTGANNGKVDVGQVVSAIENGQSIKMNDFAREEKMDDLYKLTAKAVDKAGNETEKSIMFSVNRYGSVYVLDDATWKEKDGWLSTDAEDYTYIRNEQELGVMEYNVDSIETSSITVNRDGELMALKENSDYTVKSSGSEAQWKTNHYVLAEDNFAGEGNYTVIFNTQDKAKNSMNNTSVKRSNKNLPIAFTVDKTAPTVVVSGVEDGGQYRSAERIMTVDAKDNLALAKVTINVDGTETVYEAEELRGLDGVIETAVSSANNWQSIEITSEDAAGNKLGQTKENDEEQPVVIRVLVTPNIVIQYVMNKPLFYGSIGAVVVMVGLIGFLIWRKKKELQVK